MQHYTTYTDILYASLWSLEINIEGEDNFLWDFYAERSAAVYYIDCRSKSAFGIRTFPFINDQNATTLGTRLMHSIANILLFKSSNALAEPGPVSPDWLWSACVYLFNVVYDLCGVLLYIIDDHQRRWWSAIIILFHLQIQATDQAVMWHACDDCDIKCNGIRNYREHLNGRKHQATIFEREFQKQRSENCPSYSADACVHDIFYSVHTQRDEVSDNIYSSWCFCQGTLGTG